VMPFSSSAGGAERAEGELSVIHYRVYFLTVLGMLEICPDLISL
jgi:hypothetical protein